MMTDTCSGEEASERRRGTRTDEGKAVFRAHF